MARLCPPPTATYASRAEHEAALAAAGALPRGFRVGTAPLTFTAAETGGEASMRLTLVVLDAPTTSAAAMFTSNRVAGAPVVAGRRRMAAGAPLQAVMVNNKVANVGAPGALEACEDLCAAAAEELGLDGGADAVLPSSTGVIGWRLPSEAMAAALPRAAAALQDASALPAAASIMTTDRFPKLRSYASAAHGWRVVGVAKGAGMIEPNMATMLAFVLTDADAGRDVMDGALRDAVATSFNCASVDSDQSTSDTAVLLSSRRVPAGGAEGLRELREAVAAVAQGLAHDVVRNGEGTQHVMRVEVVGAPSRALAVGAGKAVANSPLFKCAVAGNDPNVGRAVAAVGSYLGREDAAGEVDMGRCTVSIGGEVVYRNGCFELDEAKEGRLHAHMRAAQQFPPEVPEGERDYPPHQRCVDVKVDLGCWGGAGESAVVFGSCLTAEYVAINADYRS